MSDSATAPAGGRRALSAALTLTAVLPQFGVSVVAPALPDLAGLPGADTYGPQLVVVSYLAGFALSVLAAGMLADRHGVRRVQLGALALSVAAGAVCALAPNLPVLVAGRFAQALGACAATVLARLAVQEVCPEADRIRTLTTLTAAIAVTPCLAPVVGGYLVERASWRWIFVATAALGALAAFLLYALMPRPTHTPRRPPRPRALAAAYAHHLRSPGYRGCVAAICLATMAYVVFVTHSAHALGVGERLGPTAYGALTALTALGAVAGALAVRALAGRVDLALLLWRCGLVLAVGAAVLLFAVACAPRSAWAVFGPMTLVSAGVGAVLPASQAAMLHSAGARAGTACGFFFCLQQLAGAVYGWGVGQLPVTGPPTLALCIALPGVALAFLRPAALSGTARHNPARSDSDQARRKSGRRQ